MHLLLETTSGISLLDLLADAYLLLIQHDDSLKGISEDKEINQTGFTYTENTLAWNSYKVTDLLEKVYLSF
jgi:hypothetical protein